MRVLIVGIVIVFMLISCKPNESYQTITPKDAYNRLQEEEIILLDVRTEMEYVEGSIPGSILVPYDLIEEHIDEIVSDKEATIFIFCRSGRRSEIAVNSLLELGYTDVFDLGGIIDWPYDIY